MLEIIDLGYDFFNFCSKSRIEICFKTQNLNYIQFQINKLKICF